MSQRAVDILGARRWLDRRVREGDEAPATDAATRYKADDAARVGAATAVPGQPWRGGIEWLREAAKAGDTDAMVHLGGMLVDGPGTFDEAESWLRKAADAGNALGRYHFARLLLFTGRANESEQWFSALFAERPDLVMSLVGDFKMRGASDLAQEWLEKAATRGWLAPLAASGDELAAAALGFHLVAEGDYEQARPVLEQAAAAGVHEVQPALAGIYSAENRVDDAFASLERAASAGDTQSAHDFAPVMLERGDRAGAMRAHRIAANAGHADAALKLSRLLIADRQFPEAMRWLSDPAVADLPDRALTLAIAQAESGDRDAAEETLKTAAQAGDSRAAHNLALLYDEAGDSERALAWYERAAGQDDLRSMYNLGVLLANRDPAESERWLKRASTRGHVKAPYALARAAFNAGRHDDAIAWLQTGSQHGDERADRTLAELAQMDRARGGRRGWWRRSSQ